MNFEDFIPPYEDPKGKKKVDDGEGDAAEAGCSTQAARTDE